MDTESFLTAAGGLLAVPSTTDRPDQLLRALDCVLDFVGPGFTLERFESGGKPSALLYAGPADAVSADATAADAVSPYAVSPGAGPAEADPARPHFRVILNAHLDVVPAPPEQFRPRREGTRLYARGAQDMKVSALVQSLVFRELAGTLPYPVALQLVTDEEVGGRDGTLHQLGLGVTGDFVVIGEHSGLRIVTDSKGMVTATLRAVGRAGHSAYPWLADNALVKLQHSVAAVLAAYPVATQEAWRTTVNVARIETPNQTRNQVPDLAEAWLDIRFPPQDADFAGKTPEQVASYLATFCEPGVTPIVEHADPPHHADQDGPDVRALQRAARGQGYSGDFLRKHGAADGRFYYQRGIDAVIFGVGGDGLHGAQEYVDITSIEPYYRALREFLLNLAPGAVPEP